MSGISGKMTALNTVAWLTNWVQSQSSTFPLSHIHLFLLPVSPALGTLEYAHGVLDKRMESSDSEPPQAFECKVKNRAKSILST